MTILSCPNCNYQFSKNDVDKQTQLKTIEIENRLRTEYERKNNQEIVNLKQQLEQQNKLENSYREKILTLEKKQELEKKTIENQAKLIAQAELENKYRLERESDQKKFLLLTQEIATLKQKAEQGSMQFQGEIQELFIEEELSKCFVQLGDTIEEVKKGQHGADCVQIVRDRGEICGRILWESKRTKEFSEKWIEKLKEDLKQIPSDVSVVAVLVTQALPKDMKKINNNFNNPQSSLSPLGKRDGIWICELRELTVVAKLLRYELIEVHRTRHQNDQKEHKMERLYRYCTSKQFELQWQALTDGFYKIEKLFEKEKEQMYKIWKEREDALKKILLSSQNLKTEIEDFSEKNNLLEFNNKNKISEGEYLVLEE